jgi:hypothetical protein
VFPRCASLRQLRFVSLFDPLIERLQNSRIHGGDHIDRRIEFFFRHAGFPCVRKAAVNSWIAKPHHRDGETDQHLFALGETFDGVRVAVECTKIRFLQGRYSCQAGGRSMLRPYKSETQSSALIAQHSLTPASRP